MSNLTLQRKFDIWWDFQNDDITKVSLGKRYGVSARTVGRCLDLIGTMTLNDLKDQGVDTSAYDNNEVTAVEESDPVEIETNPSPEKVTSTIDNYVITRMSVIVTIDGDPRTMESSNAHYSKVCAALMGGDDKTVISLMDIPKTIERYSQGLITVTDGCIYYAGSQVDNTLTRYILESFNQGKVPTGVVNFLENLMENPSYRAVQELYNFISKTDLPITDDGYFLAYKKVRDDYTDVHSGKFDNSVGCKPSMLRNMVDEDASRTCSAGLHFCAESYLTSFSGSRVMVVKVNPRDVVAIPVDYGYAKARACEYEVVGELRDGTRLDSFYQNVIPT